MPSCLFAEEGKRLVMKLLMMKIKLFGRGRESLVSESTALGSTWLSRESLGINKMFCAAMEQTQWGILLPKMGYGQSRVMSIW